MYGYYFCDFFGPSAGPREIGKKARKCDRGDQLEGFHQVPNQLKKKEQRFYPKRSQVQFCSHRVAFAVKQKIRTYRKTHGFVNFTTYLEQAKNAGAP